MDAKWFWSAAILCAFLAAPVSADPRAPVGTAFTYQGQLKMTGLPLTATADFQFSLWDALSLGTQIGSTIAVNGQSVSNGLFTAQLDFGAGVFPGDGRWLEIAVRTPAGSGSYTTLSPRQKLTGTPYALGLQLPYAGTTSLLGDAFWITNNPSMVAGRAVRGSLGAAPSFTWDVAAGVRGESDYTGAVGVHGVASCGVLGQTSDGYGVQGSAEGTGGFGVYGRATGSGGIGVMGQTFGANSYAGYFDGRGYFEGDVGIGVEPPTAKLDVNGTAKVSGNTSVLGNLAVGTTVQRAGLQVAGGSITQNDSGPGYGVMSVLTATGTTDANGDFYLDVPLSLYYSWQADNYMFKVEVFVSLDANSEFPHGNKGSAYSMALVAKQRGDGLEDFYQAITHANDATVTFTYSTPVTDVLRVSINTNRDLGILYRVTIKISH